MSINSLFELQIARRVLFGGAFAATLAATVGGLQVRIEAQQAKTSAPPTAYTQAFVRDPKIPIDEEYTAKIKEYTTRAVLQLAARGLSAGVEDRADAEGGARRRRRRARQAAVRRRGLPVHAHAREGRAAAREGRTRIGKTEEGREMIAVAISSEANMAKLEENRAPPRQARPIRAPSTWTMRRPKRWSARRRRSTTSPARSTRRKPGAPTALMELAYRLVVDDHEYIKSIRNNLITLITPVVEVDGRDKMVDVYKWHLAHPGPELAEPRLLGQVRRARQQPRRDGRHAEAHRERAEHVHAVESAGAARPARVGAVPVRQHRRRRPVQRVDRSDPGRRVGDDRLEQRVGDDEVRHAGRVHARQLRHVVARLSDVHRRAAQRHQPAVRNVRQRRRRHGRARRCVAERVRAHLVQTESAAAEDASGRSATTTTTSRPACSRRSTTSPATASCSSATSI